MEDLEGCALCTSVIKGDRPARIVYKLYVHTALSKKHMNCFMNTILILPLYFLARESL